MVTVVMTIQMETSTKREIIENEKKCQLTLAVVHINAEGAGAK